ncbi:DUF4870 domain-containing protein [Chloroflexota bacterium]
MTKTIGGLEENVAGLLCYLVGWVSGLIFLLLEPKNKFVRFHAMQSIIVFGFLTIVGNVFGWLPFFNVFIWPFIGALTFVLWIVLMIKAYQGTLYKLPVTGDLAENWTSKQDKAEKE